MRRVLVALTLMLAMLGLATPAQAYSERIYQKSYYCSSYGMKTQVIVRFRSGSDGFTRIDSVRVGGNTSTPWRLRAHGKFHYQLARDYGTSITKPIYPRNWIGFRTGRSSVTFYQKRTNVWPTPKSRCAFKMRF